MTHSQLVQAATDLMSEVSAPDQWLQLYDAALASSDDREGEELVYKLNVSMGRIPLAA